MLLFRIFWANGRPKKSRMGRGQDTYIHARYIQTDTATYRGAELVKTVDKLCTYVKLT